jgi:hypothetical protein
LSAKDNDTDTRAPLVLVEWVDAASVTDRWQDREVAIEAGLHYSGDPILACGFLIAERKDVIVIALTFNHHNDDVSHVMAIPVPAVKSIIHLRGVKGSKMPGNVTTL